MGEKKKVKTEQQLSTYSKSTNGKKSNEFHRNIGVVNFASMHDSEKSLLFHSAYLKFPFPSSSLTSKETLKVYTSLSGVGRTKSLT